MLKFIHDKYINIGLDIIFKLIFKSKNATKYKLKNNLYDDIADVNNYNNQGMYENFKLNIILRVYLAKILKEILKLR